METYPKSESGLRCIFNASLSTAMEAAEVPTPPPPEMSNEDRSAAVVAEPSGDPDCVAVSLPAAAEDEDGAMPADFERLWEAAHDSPHDFASWTDLLQYCEQEGHHVASRRALVAFLARYPLCYGYWKKFADLERRAGNNDKAAEVCVQGLHSIPLSVDLWIHYINLLLGTLDMNLIESPKRIRSVFEDAVVAAGLDFHSDRLWDLYVEWEKEQGNVGNATAVLDRVLKVPTQLYNTHYEKFKAHLSSHEPKEVLSLEEYEEVRAFCRESQKVERAEQAKEKEEERPPGEEEPATPEGTDSEELMQRIREQVLLRRDKVYQENEDEVRKRWNFEDAIKRPYFHVRLLDHAQLRGWHSYLDWELAQLNTDTQANKDANESDTDVKDATEDTAQPRQETQETAGARDDHRVRVLFERCLIACALYEEFWTRYIQYLEPLSVDEARAVYKRACEIHLPSRPNIHMQRATFEEKHGDLAEARRVLEALEKNTPGLAVVRLRRAALERRAGQLERSEALLQEAVAQSKEKPTLHAFYSIKLARLLLKLGRNPSRARSVLQEALEISPDNDKLHLNLFELELEGEPLSSAKAVQECVTRALAAPLASHTKLRFSQRGLQFAEEYSDSIKSVMSVYEEHQKLLKELGGTKREAENGDEDPEKKSKDDDGSAADASAQAPDATTHTPITTPPPQAMSTDTSGQAGYGAYSNWYQQQQYCSYGYQNAWNYNQGYYPPS
ncbi:pre-mRNA-processing factor 39 isoform X2 [Dunckerocampus dactyliophorus]|uniref:pre-mRNA-processing factor 39 isoform X2 n=1 Tax=Dunckerocampus dactyliophorus TaxID=161453 RepID=UPI0024069022|nr:pre-mRNA-processing factor 39 isoform X2 [Dunckerocampus dactyliophorus]XP_054647853.1 pre-mRNA-processing factor 39 isoform X2 [Dunckerocampus dactyliophorus]